VGDLKHRVFQPILHPFNNYRGGNMDGTWMLKEKRISYVVCPSCKQLVKKEDIVNNGFKSCWRCVEI